MKNIIAMLFVVIACGCESLPFTAMKEKFRIGDPTTIDYPEGLDKARAFFKDENFGRAEDEVKIYLNTTKDVYWVGHAYLLLGEIREKAALTGQAIEAYDQAVKYGAGYHSIVAAEALYRTSWIYERNGSYENLLVVLKDLEKNLSDAEAFVKYVETPARMANVYYILGVWDKALEKRAQVTSEKAERYRSLAKDEKSYFHAKYYLSFLALKPIKETPLRSTEVLKMSQKELLDIGEMGEETVAAKAFDAIEGEYKRYLDQLRNQKPAKNQMQVVQRDRTSLGEVASYVDLMEELFAGRRPPEVVENQKLDIDFFKRMEVLKNEARQFSRKLEIGIQKTTKNQKTPQEVKDPIKSPVQPTPVKTPPPPPKPVSPNKELESKDPNFKKE